MSRLLTTIVLAQLAAKAYAGCAVMHNDGNTVYTVQVEIGTPPQTLRLVADAGSSDLVTASPACTNCGSSHQTYNALSSSTKTDTNKSGILSYGQGSVGVVLVKDSVSVAGTKATQCPVAAIVGQQMLEGFENAAYDGILGLGPTESSGDGSGATYLSLVGEGVYSICFGSNAQQGRLEIGSGIGTGYGSSMTSIGNEHWSVAMHSIKANGTEQPIQGNAIIDSGTSFIGVPTGVKAYLDEVIGSVDPACNNLHALPDVTIQLGSQDFVLTPSDYVVRLTAGGENAGWSVAAAATKKLIADSPFNFSKVIDGIPAHVAETQAGACTTAFFEYDDGKANAILGIPFMRAWSVRFSRKDHQVSFAKVQGGMCTACASTAKKHVASTSSQLVPPNPEVAAEKLPLIRLDQMKLPWHLVARRWGSD